MYLTNKEKYRKLCEQERTIPIFSKDWWLDSVTGGGWNVALVEKGDEIVASCPFYLVKKKLFRLITMPKLTQTLGIWIKYPQNQKNASRLSYEKKIINELIEQFPKVDYFSQNFFCFLTNWLPFYWKGFQQTTRYTYRIDLSKTILEIEADLDQENRTAIRKGSKYCRLEQENNVNNLYSLVNKTFSRQKKQTPFSKEFLEKIYSAVLEHNAGRIYIARNKDDNTPVAGVLFVSDAETVYYLVSGFDQKYASVRPINFLVWSAICDAKNSGMKYFDFEGSMVEDIERLFRSFGAVQTPYFNVSKTPSRTLRLCKAMRDILR